MESYADRSRVLTHQSCPRRRYFEYEVPTSGKVNGVRPARLDMNLLTGSCFHKGIEELLLAVKAELSPKDFDIRVDMAVESALEEFWPAVKAQGLILDPDEDASYVAYEQASLIEALIRAYAIFVLPQVIERFQVVEVEQEEVGRFEIPGFVLNFGARLDGLLLERDSLNLYVLSLKTTKEWGKRDDDSARHDMQGLSEVRVVEQKLARWEAQVKQSGRALEGVPQWFIDRSIAGAPPTVTGVIMQFALKGRRENSPRGSGKYCFNNPLIRPWKKADDLGGPSYAFRYEFQDPMGGNHRLGKGWNRVNIWEDMGVKAWVEHLASHELQGFPRGAALEAQFVLPIEYYRNPEDMDRWERQIIHQEKRVAEARYKMFMEDAPLGPDQENWADDFSHLLDEHFPMHTKSCDWPTKCSFQEICFGPPAYLHDPLSSGLYQIREANHDSEYVHRNI